MPHPAPRTPNRPLNRLCACHSMVHTVLLIQEDQFVYGTMVHSLRCSPTDAVPCRHKASVPTQHPRERGATQCLQLGRVQQSFLYTERTPWLPAGLSPQCLAGAHQQVSSAARTNQWRSECVSRTSAARTNQCTFPCPIRVPCRDRRCTHCFPSGTGPRSRPRTRPSWDDWSH